MDLEERSGPDGALDDPLPSSPLPILACWLEEARRSVAIRNHDAMALSTVDEAGLPRVRMVLCRGFDAEQATFAFYTNRESPKARDLEGIGRASALFYWDALARQVRLSGPVERVSDADSDAYFATRHRGSQIAAWTSAQSEPIESRAALMASFEQVAARYDGLERGDPIPRPSFWGGYVLIAERIELWSERAGRLHDRALWSRQGPAELGPPPAWRVQRLQP